MRCVRYAREIVVAGGSGYLYLKLGDSDLLPASCPLMWLPVRPRAENSDGCSFTSISLRRLFSLLVCMNRKKVHEIASRAISSTELQENKQINCQSKVSQSANKGVWRLFAIHNSH